MAKSIKELKKENSFLKSKCEKSDVTLIELVDEVYIFVLFFFLILYHWVRLNPHTQVNTSPPPTLPLGIGMPSPLTLGWLWLYLLYFYISHTGSIQPCKFFKYTIACTSSILYIGQLSFVEECDDIFHLPQSLMVLSCIYYPRKHF